jgi:VWFA-related protein
LKGLFFRLLRGAADSKNHQKIKKRKDKTRTKTVVLMIHFITAAPGIKMPCDKEYLSSGYLEKAFQKRQIQYMIAKIFGVSEKIEMQRFWVIWGFLLFSAAAGFAQEAGPTPPATEDVVKISTNIIQLDVTVTDKSGKVVGDLKPGDFEIYENGEKQDISNFLFVSAAGTRAEVVKNRKDAPGIPPPPRTMRPEQVRRTIALVVDDLTLSFESAYRVRQALKKYVDEQMNDGDLVAIIRTGGGIGALQQFTSNKQQLYAAIERVRWSARRGRVGAFEPLNELPDSIRQEDEEDRKVREDFENSAADFQESVFSTGTLGSLKFIVSGMKQLPGRKSVILFSDGFRIFSRSESASSDAATRVLDFLKRLIDEANRASVVFYTVDPRGLQYTGLTAADNVRPNPNALAQVMSNRGREMYDTQQGLVMLARETGGISIYNRNDLTDGVRDIVEDQSYYLIAYQPDTDTFDPKTRRFNKLEIKVKREGVKVRYRSGFFNIADESLQRKPAATGQIQQLNAAITSPFAVNDISLRLNTIFGNSPGGSFVTALLHINTKDVKFVDTPDGSKKAVLDVLAMTFGDNGVPVDQVAKSFTFTIKPHVYESVLKSGFLVNFTYPVQKAGAYQFRVAVRGAQAQTSGSANQFIEIPDLGKNRLTVSGILLENLTKEQWNYFSGAAPPAGGWPKTFEPTDPLSDTSIRKFKRGTVLRYGYEIYNAKAALSAKIRIFKDDKLVMDGQETPVDLSGQNDPQRIKAGGALDLPPALLPGDYVMQIIVTDKAGNGKPKTGTQFVQFEIE